MHRRNNSLKIALLLSLIHLIAGNMVGMSVNDHHVLDIVFLPYTFIAGISQFAGWDMVSFVLELGSFLLMTAVFYPLGMLITRRRA